MIKSILVFTLFFALSACGTAKGLMNGTAEIFEGAGRDARSISQYLD